jgi:hypothetical protein
MSDPIREKEKLIESLEQQITHTMESVESPFDILDDFTLWQCYIKLDSDAETQIQLEQMHPSLAYGVNVKERISTFIDIIRSMR